jgi:N6-L-threonylcarbamoyladenine synthase
VTANRAVRGSLQALCQELQVELFIPPADLCTDNAAMAALAIEKWNQQIFAPLDLDAQPNFLG